MVFPNPGIMRKSFVLFLILLSRIQCYPADIEIVVSRNSTVTERFAAEELGKYLYRITGENFRVVSSVSGKRFDLIVRNAGEAEKKEMKLGEEDFIIRSRGNALILSGGGNRGTLYAVYSFLEMLGCRWYYPYETDEVIPALKGAEVMKIAEGFDVLERPDFKYRIYQYQTHDIGSSESEEAAEAFGNFPDRIDWLCKNRFNIFQFGLDGKNSYEHWPEYRKNMNELIKRDMIPGISGHSYFLLLPDSVFGKHPEWWPERDGKRQKAGQFCTRNKEVVEYYLKNITGFLRENPDIKYFTVWPADTYGWCNCSLCGSDSTVADRYMELSNLIYRELKKEFPEIIFNHFAYGSHLEAPVHQKPPRDMLVTVCTWGRDFSQPFTQMSAPNGWPGNYYKDDFRKEFDAWRRITESTGSPMLFHEKYIRHLGFGYLPLPLEILEDDIRYFKNSGLDGFELPMGFMGLRTKALNLYALAKLMWRSETDINDLLKEYFSNFYGKSGLLMKAAYENLTEAQPNLKYFTELQKLEKDISPVEKYRQQDLDYSVKALYYFSSARKYAGLALASSESDIFRSRIEKFIISLDYISEEYRGLLALSSASIHLKKVEASKDISYADKEISIAIEYIVKAKESGDKRQKMIREHHGQGLIWDTNFKGPVCIFYDNDIDKYDELINNLKEQLN